MVKLSKEAKQRLQQLFKGGQFAIRWGFIPLVIYLGFKRGADPGMPEPTVLRVWWLTPAISALWKAKVGRSWEGCLRLGVQDQPGQHSEIQLYQKKKTYFGDKGLFGLLDLEAISGQHGRCVLWLG
uniref:Mitochondrial import receptor subunit TOM7 homolog n=1 Tax=Piliocolobus tephrosceles TaxID=591936 RepID=A0A8C9IY57_9PRIM